MSRTLSDVMDGLEQLEYLLPEDGSKPLRIIDPPSRESRSTEEVRQEKVEELMDRTDIDTHRRLGVREKYRPRIVLHPRQLKLAEKMRNQGYTIRDIAKAIGCSPARAYRFLREGV